MNIITIAEYNEQKDEFVLTQGALSVSVDAGTVARILDTYDEPLEFIGVTLKPEHMHKLTTGACNAEIDAKAETN